ncbi:MAG: M48 family metallopeptidase [Flavobacteriales bacterium]
MYKILKRYSIQFSDYQVVVSEKKIRTVRLKFKSAEAYFTLSVPKGMEKAEYIKFLEANIDWMHIAWKKSIETKAKQLSYADGELHPFFGEQYPLKYIEDEARYAANFENNTLVLQGPKSATAEEKERIMDWFLKNRLHQELRPMFSKWEAIIGKQASRITVRKMKTKWGSCNIRSRRITINSELAKQKKEHIEHVVVHELAHLIEANHSPAFYALLDKFQPGWQTLHKAIQAHGISCH